jgi:hypothetical protein
MKTIITLLFFASSVGTVAAQGSSLSIPMSVLNSFTTLYPDIRDVRWDQDEMSYEASFKLKNKKVFLSFDENGYVNEVKNELIAFEVPSGIKSMLETNYPDWNMNKALHVSVNGNGYYEMILGKKGDADKGEGQEGITLVFDHTGKLILTVID